MTHGCTQQNRSKKSSSCSSINNMNRISEAHAVFNKNLNTIKHCTEFMDELLACGITH